MCRSGALRGLCFWERGRGRGSQLCAASLRWGASARSTLLGRLCMARCAHGIVRGNLVGGAGSLAAIGPLSTIGLLSEAPAEKPNLPKPQRLASVWSASLSLLSAQPFESVPGTHCSVPLLCPTTLTHYSDLLL